MLCRSQKIKLLCYAQAHELLLTTTIFMKKMSDYIPHLLQSNSKVPNPDIPGSGSTDGYLCPLHQR